MKNITLALSATLLFSSLVHANDTTEIQTLKQEIQELREMTQTLLDETSDLKTGFTYTTADEEKSHSGLGAAASKIYYSKSPLSIGGYGEMFYANTSNDDGTTSSVVDVYRFIPYIGYKFSDNIILNTEIEFEHGGVDANGGGGEVIVEFMYLDFLINNNFNVRTGNMLVPMGLINERHEPTLFNTVQRPQTAKYLIPSTWHESGVMAYGDIVDNVEYKVAGLTALKATDDGDKWLRDGRGGSYKNNDPKLAVVARVDYTGINGLMTGISLYNDSKIRMTDIHLDYKNSGARVYGVYTQTTRKDATGVEVESANGGYINGSFDVLTLTSSEKQLPVFVQYETRDAQAELADGTKGDATKNITLGLNYFPHPQVVLKTDYLLSEKDGKTDKTASISMGFIF